MPNGQTIKVITDKLLEIKESNCFPEHILTIHQLKVFCPNLSIGEINEVLLGLELDGAITSLVKEGFEKDTTILKFRIN